MNRASRLAVSALSATALAGSLLAAAPAAEALAPTNAVRGSTTATATATTGALALGWNSTYRYLYSGCYYYPVTFSATVPDDAVSWDVKLTLTAPDGQQAGSGYAYGDDPAGVVKGSKSFYLCGSLDPAGRYTVRGTLEWYNAEYEDFAATAPAKTVSLPKAWTKTTLTVSPKRPKYKGKIKLTAVSTTPKPGGTKAVQWPVVRFQQYVKGKWRTADTVYGSKAGKSTETYQWLIKHGKSGKLRAITNATDGYKKSISKVKKVKTR